MKLINTFRTSALLAMAVLAMVALTNCNKDDDDDDNNPSSTNPTAAFSYSAEGQMVTFTFTGQNATDYLWDFGDGNTSEEASPVHTYASAGTYTVELTVENASGSDSESQEVMVEAAAAAEAPELDLGDADGAFYAINSITIQEVAGFESVIKLGSAVAWCSDGSTFVDVGDINVSNTNLEATLEKQSNNAYTYVETGMSPSGYNNNGVSWTMDGGSGHPQIGGGGLANLNPFPSARKVNEANSDISGNAAYTLRHDGAINNADSSIFSVIGPDGTVMKTVGGTETSVSFNANEMASIGKGAGILQIASFSIATQSLSGKKYYMINESVASKNVNIN